MQELATELDSLGHKVTVLTISPKSQSRLDIACENGVVVLRVQTRDIKRASRIERALTEARLSQAVWKAAHSYLQDTPQDLIVFYSPTIFWGKLVGRLRQLWSCPAYLILRDVFPDWARDTGQMPAGPIFRYFRHHAVVQFRAASIVGVEAESGKEYLHNCYPRLGRPVEVLRNWTRIDEVQAPDPAFRKKLGLESKVIFFYGGNIGAAQDMNNLLDLAGRLRHREDIHFVFVGRGSEVPRIRAVIESGGAPNISLIDAVPESAYLSMVASSDIGLISLDRRLRSRNVPGKLLGYLKQRIPVLASINPGNDLLSMIEQAGVGLCSVTGDHELLARNALQLADDKGLRERMAANTSRFLLESFSVRHAAEQILGSADRV